MKLGIDIGGTFTDLVLLDEATGRLCFGKTLTTYPDPVEGILKGIDGLKAQHGANLADVDTLIHGTTLVTNAVIERKGAKTALLTTRGFEDVLEIGREMRYDIYDLDLVMPKPLVPRNLRWGVTERVDKSGRVLTPLEPAEVEAAIERIASEDIESVAVVFLHSFATPAHEHMMGERLRERFPGLHVSLSSEVMPEIREYERGSATAMNAYVQPLTSEYLGSLQRRLQERGFKGTLHVMISSGRLTTLEGAVRTPIQLLESGPAGGTMAGVFVGRLTDKPDLVAFDMGGTTAKASMIRGHAPEITNHFEAAREKRFKKGSGLPVRIPVIDMIEIGAGGGSIARVNKLGLLTVGPDSASSTPGPACYGTGGEEPTVTDADLVLGFLNPEFFLGGTMKLDREKAVDALRSKIAEPLGITVEQAAWGIHRIVNENMANAARVHILEKGLDPRRFSMLAFGGAGPVHAFEVARLMHAPQLIIPAGAGVLSALGFLVSPVASEELTSHVCRLDAMDWERVNAFLHGMEVKAAGFVTGTGVEIGKVETTRVAEMRYCGQGHEISVQIPSGRLSAESIDAIEESFRSEYLSRYGRIIEKMPMETVTWRVVASGPAPKLDPKQSVVGRHDRALKGMRPVYLGEGYVDAPVYDRYLVREGEVIPGPCIIEEYESTTVVGRDSSVRVDAFRNVIIDLHQP